MARPTRTLIDALRGAARNLAEGAEYSWTHMGSCNCGHLAQMLTDRSKEEIHRMALQKAGDWGEQAVEHCPVSGYPIDHILATMVEVGMTLQDINDLEKLASARVLSSVPRARRPLDYRRREDVVVYMRAWADQLEAELRAEQGAAPLPELNALARAGEARDAQVAVVGPR